MKDFITFSIRKHYPERLWRDIPRPERCFGEHLEDRFWFEWRDQIKRVKAAYRKYGLEAALYLREPAIVVKYRLKEILLRPGSLELEMQIEVISNYWVVVMEEQRPSRGT